jgi:hypothetical protein
MKFKLNKKYFIFPFLFLVSLPLFSKGVFDTYYTSGDRETIYEYTFDIGSNINNYRDFLEKNNIIYYMESFHIITVNWNIHDSVFEKTSIADNNGIIRKSIISIPNQTNLDALIILACIDNLDQVRRRGPPWNVNIKNKNGLTCVRYITMDFGNVVEDFKTIIIELYFD